MLLNMLDSSYIKSLVSVI